MYTKPVDVAAPHHFTGPKSKMGGPNYDPLSWNEIFDKKESILGGQVPLYIAGNKGHVFLCMHGAGHSALSFAALAKQMKEQSTVVAFDFRGHGEHFCENETDLSEDTLIAEGIRVFEAVAGIYRDASIILVGHSMGGSIATKTASKILADHKSDEWHKQL
jgi:protein phosphatase methylesterase 1